MACVVKASFFHLALIGDERYLAMKRRFAHITLVTEARLLVSAALAWLLSIILGITFAVDETLYATINFISLSIASIVYCHVACRLP